MSTQKQQFGAVQDDPALLRDNPPAVTDEPIQRLIQLGSSGSYSVTLNKMFLRQIGLDVDSAPTTQYFVSGVRPVIVTEPAIIIQPNGGEADAE